MRVCAGAGRNFVSDWDTDVCTGWWALQMDWAEATGVG